MAAKEHECGRDVPRPERRSWYRVHHNAPAVSFDTSFHELAIEKARESYLRQGPTDTRPVHVTLVESDGDAFHHPGHVTETTVGYFGADGWNTKGRREVMP